MGDIYIGDNNGIARKVNSIYVGDANGIARKVQNIYVGDANGIARKVYSAFDPNIGGGSASVDLTYGTYRSGTLLTIARSRINEALANGYTKLTGSYSLSWGNLGTTSNRVDLAVQNTNQGSANYLYSINTGRRDSYYGSASGSFEMNLSAFSSDGCIRLWGYADSGAYAGASVSNVRFS